MSQKIWDVVIVGSGAGGSLAFQHYVAKGLGVLLLEEGTESLGTMKNHSITDVTKKMYRNGGLRVALGLPSLTIGEGNAIGGGTEVNGGLFWRTPRFVLEQWRLIAPMINQESLEREFLKLERELNVQIQKPLEGFDLDSHMLELGSRKLGWKISDVPRLVVDCKRRNKCPSGCPSGAKQSMSKTLVESAIREGGSVESNVKVHSITLGKDLLTIKTKGSREKDFLAKRVVLSAGAIETPRILKNSGLIKTMKSTVGFHANFKIVAKFPCEVNSKLGSIFTKQIHEFLEDGLLIMGSNFNSSYLAMASSHIDGRPYSNLKNHFPNLALYTVQIKADSFIYDLKAPFIGYLPFVKWKASDKIKVRQALLRTSQVLFAAGAEYLILPFSGDNHCYNFDDAKKVINKSSFTKLNISTVHLMSSLPLSNAPKSCIDAGSQLKKDVRVQVLDASILPTTIGESPQGSIMALVRLILNK